MIYARDIRWMSREELEQALVDAGFHVFDHETDTELENALLEHYESEGQEVIYN